MRPIGKTQQEETPVEKEEVSTQTQESPDVDTIELTKEVIESLKRYITYLEDRKQDSERYVIMLGDEINKHEKKLEGLYKILKDEQMQSEELQE